MKHPFVLGWAFVLAMAIALPQAHAEEDTAEAEEKASEEEDGGRAPGAAGEANKSLAERIPSVTRRAFSKGGRVEIYPAVGFSLNDPFYDHVTLSGGLSFHIFESLAIGISGDFLASMQSQVPIASLNRDQPLLNRPTYIGRLELAWAPLYGKLSLLAEQVMHFDTYLLFGGGVVGLKDGDPAGALSVGIGQHFFFNEWFGLRLEMRDQIFQMSRGTSNNKDVQNLLSASMGVCFYLPPDFEREAL